MGPMQVNAPTASSVRNLKRAVLFNSCLGGRQTEGVDSDEESNIDWRIENETKGSR